MARRRRRRRGVTEHEGVTLLRPGKDCPYFQLRWLDPDGRRRKRSTRFTTEGPARQEAIKLSRRLAALAGSETDVLWPEFCRRYEEERLAASPKKTLSAWRTASGWYTNLMQPTSLDDITASAVSRFTAKLRAALEVQNGRAPDSTVASYLKMLRAAFNWAATIGLLPERVRVIVPSGEVMRSRPITPVEFWRILGAVPVVRPDDAAQWQRFLWGLWESGFRLSEVAALSWDVGGDVAIDLSHRFPMVRFARAGQKSRRQQLQPISQEFWAFISRTPAEKRRGRVFPLVSAQGRQYATDWIGTVIRRFGQRALVRTGLEDSEKLASSHDIGKRPFTVLLSEHLSEMDTAAWQRHKDSRTTRQHYHFRQAEELAEKLGWSEDWRKQ